MSYIISVFSWLYLLFSYVHNILKRCATRKSQLNKPVEKDSKEEANYIFSNAYLPKIRCLKGVKYVCINFPMFLFSF